MSKVRLSIELNTRAFIWIKHNLTKGEKYVDVKQFVECVVYQYLESQPGVDLSRSPFTCEKEQDHGETIEQVNRSGQSSG